MGSNEATPEPEAEKEKEKEKENENENESDLDDNSSSSDDDSSAASGSTDSNVSCVDNSSSIPVLKEMQIFIVDMPHPDEHKEADAPVEFKELSDDSGMKQKQKQQECMENEEEGSVLQNANTDVAQEEEEEIEAFSGKFDDSKVRELIESDPFLREVVDSFLRHHDEEDQNGNASANGGSTL